MSASYISFVSVKLNKLTRQLFADRDSFNLFCFLILNLSFAFVELLYGIWTNSLGLISDSFHMFFDCLALLTGLVASIISKWEKNRLFTFGYGRAEILAGLLNSLILILISFYVFKEAVERLFDQPHVHHHRLFVVSALGFIVNVVGIFVFHHGSPSGSGCCHGHDHSHSHSHHEEHGHGRDLYRDTANRDKAIVANRDSTVITIDDGKCDGQHSQRHHHGQGHFCHDHDHGHCHHDHRDHHNLNLPRASNDVVKNRGSNQIIRGVFLHILADTMGSVAVMVSSVLISHFGLMIADTLCSMVCALLIFVSAIPLLKESVFILMERMPQELQHRVLPAIDQVKRLPGVYGVTECNFWTIDTKNHCGVMKLLVAPTVDGAIVSNSARTLLSEAGVSHVTVQFEVMFQ